MSPWWKVALINITFWPAAIVGLVFACGTRGSSDGVGMNVMLRKLAVLIAELVRQRRPLS